MTSVTRRIRQGILAIAAWARPVQDEPARELLSPPLLVLFQQMPRREQQHGLEVLGTLRAMGASHPSLLAAGLLHDVGKMNAPLHILDRVLIVLAEAVYPQAVQRWGSGNEMKGWRRAFTVRANHAAWGAELVAATGADPLLVELIRRHQEKLEAPHHESELLLHALQQADDAN